MRNLLGCFGILIVVALVMAIISWLSSTILGVLGIGIAIWGIYAWIKNRKAGNRAKVPIIAAIIGIFLAFGGFSSTGNQPDVVKEKKQDSEKISSANERAKEAAKEAGAKQQAEEQAKKEEEAKQQAAEKAKQEAAQKEQQTAASLGLVAATISRVVDGDTVQLSTGQKVRLIGVNTPESTTRHETYGKEASNYTTNKLEGKQVWLQKDVSETDRYGRLLRIIWLSIPTNDMDENEIRTKMFNADLVLNGYAEPSTYPPDVKYSDVFVKFAREARSATKGLWAYGPNGTTKGDLDSAAGTAAAPASSSSGSNRSSSSTSAAAASSTQSSTSNSSAAATPSSGTTEFFQNCTELRKKYPQGVPAGHPAYQSKMDRDHDQYACETN
ncbi:thermonuclease family protein [Neobacillus sp. SM06]|uniref:thermonuclease family protein n=1 Tax=Neobacillus sp. SM06 TaxID=3422492 RepID=UPI003D2E9441